MTSRSRTIGSRSGCLVPVNPDNLRAVRLTFLGSGHAFASGGRFQACLHLGGGDEPLLIDCARIVLTHMSEQMLDRAADVDLEMAADGAVISL